MRYWLMKSEPSVYSVDDLAKEAKKGTPWSGIRNYQARNFMRDMMLPGDRVFFYHSNCDAPGIVGIAEVCRPAYPDETQFDRNSEYFDPQSTRGSPRWMNVDIRLVRKTRLAGLTELRGYRELRGMRVLARGNRLSITPVTPAEWKFVMSLL